MFDSFENIHKNKKWAFIDGLLCGLVIMKIAGMWRKTFEDTPPPFEEIESPEPISTS